MKAEAAGAQSTGKVARRAKAREAGPVDSYRALPEQAQVEARDAIVELAAHGRLFVADKKGDGLTRASAEAAYTVLETDPTKLHAVTLQTTEVNTSQASSEARYDHLAIVSEWHRGSSSSSASDQTLVQYTTAPVGGWKGLLWLDPEAEGVPGVSHLPQQGAGAVVTSAGEASKWNSSSHVIDAGFCGWDESCSDASGSSWSQTG
ncbi:MAG TPA: hypothetical protein VGO93_01965 [Candidatus Xenobia bacterium]|jgi:hypothetical protein